MLYEKGISFILFHKVPVFISYRKVHFINSLFGQVNKCGYKLVCFIIIFLVLHIQNTVNVIVLRFELACGVSPCPYSFKALFIICYYSAYIIKNLRVKLFLPTGLCKCEKLTCISLMNFRPWCMLFHFSCKIREFFKVRADFIPILTFKEFLEAFIKGRLVPTALAFSFFNKSLVLKEGCSFSFVGFKIFCQIGLYAAFG